jgi:urease accessory protein
MRSRLLIEAARGQIPRWRAEGAVTVRLTGADQLHLVSAAASPIGGDEVSVAVQIGSGASLTVSGVAASVALPGRVVDASHWSWELDVRSCGRLYLDPQPVIVAGRASHHGTTTLRLAEDGVVQLVERAQLGRFGESGGFWRSSLAVDVAGQELLRHTVELGEGSPSWDALSSPRTIESEFRYPDHRPAWVDRSSQEARFPLAGGGSLMTRLA